MSILRSIAITTVLVSMTACVVRARPAPRAVERRDDVHDARVEAMTGWDKLGERWVHGGGDRDVIHVGRDDGRFRSIRLKAEHSALELYDVEVVFGDGTRFSPGTRLVFGQGSWSRDIDLPGGDRVIRRVEFRYGNLPGGGRAQLELWGR
jgi:hypothetical protein